MKCTSCGAEIPLGTVICEYCDSAVPHAVDTPQGSRVEAFARIKRSPAYASSAIRSALSNLPGPGVFMLAIPVVLLLVWTGMAGFMGVMASSHGAPALFSVVPIFFVVIGVVGLIAVIARGVRIMSAEPQARPAIITGKRTSISGGGKNSSATTSYFATFEFESGQREELHLDARLYSQISEDDVGIVFTRAELAVKFERV